MGWIDHAMGVALGQWLTFEHGRKDTKVYTWGDIVHSGVSIGGRKVEHLITAFTEMWYENFRLMCDQGASGGQRPKRATSRRPQVAGLIDADIFVPNGRIFANVVGEELDALG